MMVVAKLTIKNLIPVVIVPGEAVDQPVNGELSVDNILYWMNIVYYLSSHVRIVIVSVIGILVAIGIRVWVGWRTVIASRLRRCNIIGLTAFLDIIVIEIDRNG